MLQFSDRQVRNVFCLFFCEKKSKKWLTMKNGCGILIQLSQESRKEVREQSSLTYVGFANANLFGTLIIKQQMTKKKFPENSLKRTIQEQTVYVEPKNSK